MSTKKNMSVVPSAPPHVVIVGGGSAAFSAAITAAELGARVTMINDGLPIGGTCVNVGCVPSKTLIRAAEVVHRAQRHSFAGVETSGRVSDFKRVIAQKRALVEELRQAKYVDVVADLPRFTRIDGRARLVSATEVEVDGRRLLADKIIIATGARPASLPIAGLGEVGYLDNESAFELEALPTSMLVIGGGYIALELAQMFARFGTKVTIVTRSRLLSRELPDIGDGLATFLVEEGVAVENHVQIESVERESGEVVLHGQRDGERVTFRAEHIVLATGRVPNTDALGLDAAGVKTDDRGFIRVNKHLQATAPGVWAAGDVAGGEMFVYTAAADGARAARNALSDESLLRSGQPTPWVVFTDPQVAGIGMDERQASAAGFDAEAATLPMSYVPRALAARDTRGFIKLIRDRKTDRLLGARILAPEGSELLMELAVVIRGQLTIAELRELLHPYLTLSEGIRLAAITFGKDVAKLSCCAT